MLPLPLPLWLRVVLKKTFDLIALSSRIAGVDEMARSGMYMSDLGMYDSSQEMVLSGIQPLPQLEYARDQVWMKPTFKVACKRKRLSLIASRRSRWRARRGDGLWKCLKAGGACNWTNFDLSLNKRQIIWLPETILSSTRIHLAPESTLTWSYEFKCSLTGCWRQTWRLPSIPFSLQTCVMLKSIRLDENVSKKATLNNRKCLTNG